MKFRKKPIVVEAMQWTGDNLFQLCKWMQRDAEANMPGPLYLTTEQGRMKAEIGDWIIRGLHGEHYVCEARAFDATYEPVP